jgi:peptidoglycan/LPS O-acetylase OafA/YrhL
MSSISQWAYAQAGHSWQSMPFTQSWSLGIEEKFYLVWPALAFCALAALPQWRAPAAWLLLVAVSLTPWYLEPAGFTQLTHCLVPLRPDPGRLRPGPVAEQPGRV